MKKITTILMLLVLTCMGVWAQETTTVWFKQAADGDNVTRGTYHNNDGSVNTNASQFVYFWKSGADEPIITLKATNNPQNVGVMAREHSRLTANGNPTYEISVSEGYIIKSYYIRFINFNDASKPKTLTTEFGPSAVTEGSERGTGGGSPVDAEVTVTNVNKVATTFTVSSADDKAIKIREFYVVVEKMSDYTPLVEENIKPWVEMIGKGYFYPDAANSDVAALKSTYESHTDDTWTKEAYHELLALLNTAKNANAILMPENGYYRIKNKVRSNPYIGYGKETSWNKVGLVGCSKDAAIKDASTLIKLEKSGDTYKLSIQGQYVTGQSQNNATFPTSTDPSEAEPFTIVPQVPGYAAFVSSNNSDGKGSLHHAGWNGTSGIVRWEASADASQWMLEEANELSGGTYGLEIALTPIDGKNYATTCLPFPVKLSEAAAYTVKVNGKQAEYTLAGDEIPAEEAVLLISDASTLTATIQETTTTVGDNDLKGVLVKTAKADLQGETPVVLNKLNGKVGFYKLADGSSLSANRAYLSYVEGTTPQPAKAFFEEGFELGGNEATAIENIENGAFENAPVYNLQGQRVTKAQKGVFIQNGKKVVVK